jgi:uncharacterized membrane protein
MEISDFGQKITIRPNNSLSAKGRVRVMLFLILIISLVAIGFAKIGAWLVLPFAGLEIALVSYAFYVVYEHSGDFESITFNEDRLTIEKKIKEKLSKTEFKCYWVQITEREVVNTRGGKAKKGLYIRSHGKEVEFGRDFMTDGQRSLLAHELKQKLRNIH